ncbi:hypothetical protein F3J38_26370 [Pantoea sp. Acro-805]|uniref:Uncharacterized protein n=1 Tax=Candidatus Pantoea formicae TaxID=2608355 RepID=A0ABX0R7Q9_9GAMM|nr:hypothetical protein [Pantoea formicae]NIF03531.1 hypothetical protein [Pantoea formicae]
MNTHNVKTAAAESTETRVKVGENRDLSPAEFLDLYGWIRANGEFTGVAGVQWARLAAMALIEEPTEEPEALKIFVRDGYPVAVQEYDTGFIVTREYYDAGQ